VFWATVVMVVVLVAYPLSIGPAIWLRDRSWAPEWASSTYFTFYAPIIWVYNNGPQPIHNLIHWYGHLGW
jgi:hypothetical protein